MARAKYPPMSAWLKELQETSSPDSECKIPDQTHIPVVSLEFLNIMNRKELTIGDEKPSFPLIFDDVEGPMEPEQLVYLHVADDSMKEWDICNESIILLNPNVPFKNEDLACVKWRGKWMLARVYIADDGHAELQFAPDKSFWIEAEETNQLEIVAPVVMHRILRPVKNILLEEEA